MRKYLLAAGIILLIGAVGTFIWIRWAKPTRIAFANYPEYMLAPMLDDPGIQRMILIISAAVVLVIIVLTIAVNSLVSRKVPENLMKFE